MSVAQDFEDGNSTDAFIDPFEIYKMEDRAKETLMNKINVKVEIDGTVTLSGLDYRDFSSMICSASLQLYDDVKKPTSSMRSYFELQQKLLDGGKPVWAGEEECLKENALSDIIYRITSRAIIDVIEKKKDAALRRHNDGYSAIEQWYFKYISDTRWKLIRFGLALKKIWQKNGYDPD